VLEGLLTSFVWITANVTYRSCVRDGERGFKRFASFWLGWPGTFVSAFSVSRTKRVSEPEVDESEAERRLLREIRRDRSLRIARGEGLDQGEPVDGAKLPGEGDDGGGASVDA
jgi:hypothetical protein